MHERLKQLPEGVALVVLVVAAGIFFAVTDPEKVSPIMFMVGFALLFSIAYCIVRLIARFLNLKGRLSPMQYTAFVFELTVLPVLLIALQSLGQLTVRDLVTLLLIFGLGYFYVSRMAGKR